MLMNLVADVLFLVGVMLFCWAGMIALQRLPVFPLRTLDVKGPLQHVSRSQLEDTAVKALGGNFFTVDIHSAQRAFQEVPWIRSVEVRRRWPDTIELRLEEHQVSARWTPLGGEERLVNSFGEVFEAHSDATLPSFAGPEGSAAQVLARFQEINQRLGPLDKQVVALQLSPREAWRMRLSDGVALDLGRDHQGEALGSRLDRFIESYPKLRERMQTALTTVDMRYPSGFVIRADSRS